MVDFMDGISMTIEKAIILAAGRGTRLRPLTHTIPKQAIPVANRPIIHYVLEQLNCAGIREIGIVVSPDNKEQLKHSIDRNPWEFKFEYIEQKLPLGLAHAVIVCKEFLKESTYTISPDSTDRVESIGPYRLLPAAVILTPTEIDLLLPRVNSLAPKKLNE